MVYSLVTNEVTIIAKPTFSLFKIADFWQKTGFRGPGKPVLGTKERARPEDRACKRIGALIDAIANRSNNPGYVVCATGALALRTSLPTRSES
jgi:hypothetical protein